MVWINFILFCTFAVSKELPRFLTKHSIETVRFISHDGRYTYVQKRPGVLGMVTSFRSVDFLSEPKSTEFLMSSSNARKRILIEAVPNSHSEYNLIKDHKLLVIDWGNIRTREVGLGRSPKLHVNDEWLTFYRPYSRAILIKNLLTDKTYELKMNPRTSPFFVPEIEMINSKILIYTEINEKGLAGILQHNLETNKSDVIYRATQAGTHINLCQGPDYLAFGEFPYDDINHGSSIMHIQFGKSINLAGFSTLYSTTEPDIGNMNCNSESIYFIKTMKFQKSINTKSSEVAKLGIKDKKLEVLTDMEHVTQIINMDGRIMIPFRGEFFVLEGTSNLSEDKLKPNQVNSNEENSIDL